MICPECNIDLGKPDGMCCNSGANSGYQYYCSKCKVWYVETWSGRITVDGFLTLLVQPKMYFVKMKLSIITRVKEIFNGINWLATTTIPVCGNAEYYESTLDFIERWDCFSSCIDTAIRGYVWRLKE